MKKIKFDKINEEIFYEKLDNGLTVYLYSKPNTSKYYVSFTTRYGSINNEFVPLGKSKMEKFPDGIAHFLEHQMFEQEEGPAPAEFFEKTGTDYNAHTSNRETGYEIWGTNNLKENLGFLLDYVQSPYFIPKNVEEEKGIIKEEILMIRDRPFDRLYEKLFFNTFHNNPFRLSISGTVSDINKIDADMLNTCYDTFYNPNNMFLVVCGSFNEEEILDYIKKNQDKKTFKKPLELKLKEYKEEDTIVKDLEVIKIDVDIPKVGISIKIPVKKFKDMEVEKLELYILMIFLILFDDTSEFYEKMKEQKIVVNPLNITLLNADSHLVINILNETEKDLSLIIEIKNYLENITISKKDLERKKKTFISSLMFTFDNVEAVNDLIANDILNYNKVISNRISIIESLNIQELSEITEKIKFDNLASVIVKKEE